MVLQRTDHEANIPFVEQNGVPQADIVFTDTDGREVALEAKSKKLPSATKRLCAIIANTRIKRKVETVKPEKG